MCGKNRPLPKDLAPNERGEGVCCVLAKGSRGGVRRKKEVG